MSAPHLPSEPLSLRAVRRQDWITIHEWAQREEVSRYQTWGPNTEEQTREFVEAALADAEVRPQARFVLSAVTAGDEVRGLVEVNVRDRRWRCADVGYAVHHRHRRRGYGTRMAYLAVSFAFAELGMHRVEATCDPRNLGSAGILRRLGMTHEGTMRDTMELDDGWRDSALFSVLEHEWTGGQP